MSQIVEVKNEIHQKLTEAETLIRQAMELAQDNDITLLPIRRIFTDSEIREELDNWDSSNC